MSPCRIMFNKTLYETESTLRRRNLVASTSSDLDDRCLALFGRYVIFIVFVLVAHVFGDHCAVMFSLFRMEALIVWEHSCWNRYDGGLADGISYDVFFS